MKRVETRKPATIAHSAEIGPVPIFACPSSLAMGRGFTARPDHT